MEKTDLVELFRARATAAAAVVTDAADEADAERQIADLRAGGASVGVARAVRGIAATGTCVVETDDEETRLETMLPETSVIVLRAEDVVADLPDVADYLRARQADGKVSYTSFITGPSRTADIERVSAIGVHGPLAFRVILVRG
ncbi:MAG: LUD domain-containing protein [Kiritimatiellae bacterium]|nr:LUD domain-containing protein [Kiritimatiellia bacterium]